MCSDVTGQCVNYEEDFAIAIKAEADIASTSPTENGDNDSVFKLDELNVAAPASQSNVVEAEQTETATTESSDLIAQDASVDRDIASMFGFMVLAFLRGLAALLTPCVFPMIPMTVTFFTGRAKSRAQGVKNALVYGFSITIIYTLAGSLVAATQ